MIHGQKKSAPDVIFMFARETRFGHAALHAKPNPSPRGDFNIVVFGARACLQQH
jgi:hypothetical protein